MKPQRSSFPKCVPKLTDPETRSLSPAEGAIVLSVQSLEDDLSGDSIRERVAELVPPALLFGDNVEMQRDIYAHLRDFLNSNDANTPIHSSRKIVIQLARGLYTDREEHKMAIKLAKSIFFWHYNQRS